MLCWLLCLVCKKQVRHDFARVHSVMESGPWHACAVSFFVPVLTAVAMDCGVSRLCGWYDNARHMPLAAELECKLHFISAPYVDLLST